jgi:hypothetical protein
MHYERKTSLLGGFISLFAHKGLTWALWFVEVTSRQDRLHAEVWTFRRYVGKRGAESFC